MAFSRLIPLVCAAVSLSFPAMAAQNDALAEGLVPHKALYEIELTATHSGSQILNISGQMVYSWKPSCDAWVTDHKFKMFYEYADAPGMRITSDFSTFEALDGKSFHFSSRRQRDGEMYQEIRGAAEIGKGGAGVAKLNMPEKIKFDLVKGTLFPMAHTLELLRHAKAGDKFYSAQIFDGSDEEGPIEINSFIGKSANIKDLQLGKKVDESLLGGQAWNVRMAVFPAKDEEEESDYEMSLVFHENGIISDMVIDYDDFSVRQRLVALEKIAADSCGSDVAAPTKP